jgi:hypothetical protein
MYKKLHTPEKEPSVEPFCDKGSFLWCVPERGIMLTDFVYHIQLKNEKPTEQGSVGFSAIDITIYQLMLGTS